MEGNISAKSFVIEKLLDHRMHKDKSYSYLIKWVGSPVEDATWEHQSQFDTVEIIVKYWATQAAKDRPLPAPGKTKAGEADPAPRRKTRRVMLGRQFDV